MEILNQFGINPVLLAAQVVNFLILLFILKKFAYGPILKVLDQRKKTIADSLKNAEEIEKQLAFTEEEKDKILAQASKEGQKMVDETKKELEALREEMKADALTQAELIIQKAHESTLAEMEKMKEELMVGVADIVAVGMEKVSGKSFSSKDKKEMIKQTVKNIS